MQATFALELATRIGQQIEVALDDSLIEGVLSFVSGNLLGVVPTSGYSDGNVLNISLSSINFVSFPPAP